jgi:hypothetical protein
MAPGICTVSGRIFVVTRFVGNVESVTVIVTTLIPPAVGVPVIDPPGLIVSPGGNPVAVNVYGWVPPLAFTVAEYAVPTVPVVSDVVVMVRLSTCTVSVAVVYPGADTLIVAVPTATPCVCGVTAGMLAPPLTTTLPGVTLTLVESVLLSVTVNPLVGAGGDSVTVSAAFCPTASDPAPLNVIVPNGCTCTVAVVSAIPVALACTTVVPGPTVVTGMATLKFPFRIVTVVGTVATPGSVELTLNVMFDCAGDEISSPSDP